MSDDKTNKNLDELIKRMDKNANDFINNTGKIPDFDEFFDEIKNKFKDLEGELQDLDFKEIARKHFDEFTRQLEKQYKKEKEQVQKHYEELLKQNINNNTKKQQILIEYYNKIGQIENKYKMQQTAAIEAEKQSVDEYIKKIKEKTNIDINTLSSLKLITNAEKEHAMKLGESLVVTEKFFSSIGEHTTSLINSIDFLFGSELANLYQIGKTAFSLINKSIFTPIKSMIKFMTSSPIESTKNMINHLLNTVKIGFANIFGDNLKSKILGIGSGKENVGESKNITTDIKDIIGGLSKEPEKEYASSKKTSISEKIEGIINTKIINFKDLASVLKFNPEYASVGSMLPRKTNCIKICEESKPKTTTPTIFKTSTVATNPKKTSEVKPTTTTTDIKQADKTIETMKTIITKPIEFIKKGINSFVNGLKNMGKSIINAVKAVGMLISKIVVLTMQFVILIAKIVLAIIQIIAMIVAQLLELGVIGLIILAIIALVIIFYLLYKKVEWVRTIINILADTLINTFKDIYNFLKPFLKLLGKLIKIELIVMSYYIKYTLILIYNIVKYTLIIIYNIVKYTFLLIYNIIKYTLIIIYNIVKYTFLGLKKAIEYAIKGVVFTFHLLIDALNFLSEVSNKVKNFIFHSFGYIKNYVIEKFIAIKNGIVNIFTSIISWIKTIPKKIFNILVSTFKNLFTGIINKIIKILPSWLKKLLGIKEIKKEKEEETKAAVGFEGIVNKPTRFLVGEAGPEYVSIIPQNKMATPSAGNVLTKTVNDFRPIINELQEIKTQLKNSNKTTNTASANDVDNSVAMDSTPQMITQDYESMVRNLILHDMLKTT